MLTLDKLKPGDLVRLKSDGACYEVKVARVDGAGLWSEHYRVTKYSFGKINRQKATIKGGLFPRPTNIRYVQKNSNK